MDKDSRMLPPIIVEWNGTLDPNNYKRAVETWMTLQNEEAEAFYRKEVFPQACARIRAKAPDDKVALLFVPVGTQAYPPILACLGQPAEAVVLLHSQRSRKYAEEVRQALCGSYMAKIYSIQIDEFDPVDISRKMLSACDVVGQPPPEQVVCDQTGGTKVMASTMSGMAALNGWSLSYVKSRFVPGRLGSYDEEIVRLPNVFEATGGWNRALAWKLASKGLFKEASRYLEAAVRESLAGIKDEQHLKRFKLAQAFREGKAAQIARSLRTVAKQHGVVLPQSTIALLKAGDLRGLYYYIALTLLEESQPMAALGWLVRLGIRLDSGTVTKKYLISLARKYREDWKLFEWKPLYVFLGSPYSREVGGIGPV